MVGTFAMVLFFTMVKEAYEDYQRYKQQKEVNNKQCFALGILKRKKAPLKSFTMKPWSEVRPGQILLIQKDEQVPADTLIISTSNQNGMAFVDTMALDGETNLKEKQTPIEDPNFQRDDLKFLTDLCGSVMSDQPNETLDYWEGLLSLKMDPGKIISCSIKNLLLRGSTIRNTEWVLGIVMYTGPETKILQNSKKPPHKVSNVMKLMNKMLMTVFIFQISIITICAGLNFKWTQANAGKH